MTGGSPEDLALWPGVPPGSQGLDFPEKTFDRGLEPGPGPDRAVSGILRPRLTPYLPSRPNGTAVIVVPGGGYVRVVLDKEGDEIARWLASLGITAFLLRYRLPGEGHRPAAPVPLQDGQRALRVIRSQAARWGLAADRIGILGCSAGGHLAGLVSAAWDRPVYPALDRADGVTARPDFTALLYPVADMAGPDAHAGSRLRLLGEAPEPAEARNWSLAALARPDQPPAFLTHAADDASVPVSHSLDLFRALRGQGVSCALHVFESGGHGHGIRGAQGRPTQSWTGLLVQWLSHGGWLEAVPKGQPGR